MYCEQCGKQIKDAAKFCQYCGAQQKAQQVREPESQAAERELQSNIPDSGESPSTGNTGSSNQGESPPIGSPSSARGSSPPYRRSTPPGSSVAGILANFMLLPSMVKAIALIIAIVFVVGLVSVIGIGDNGVPNGNYVTGSLNMTKDSRISQAFETNHFGRGENVSFRGNKMTLWYVVSTFKVTGTYELRGNQIWMKPPREDFVLFQDFFYHSGDGYFVFEYYPDGKDIWLDGKKFYRQ